MMNGYISAEFDDVFLNKSTSPYETFGIAPLSAGKWQSLERVRAPANGTLRLVVQADGERMSSGVSAAASNTAFLEAKVKVRDESTVSAGAQASARIGGWYYNATPNIGDTQDYDGRQGDVWVQNEIVLDENDNLRARVRVLRSNDSDSNSLSQIFVQNFLKAVAFGEFHTLSIERGGGVFTFKCDDEVIRYSVFGPFFPSVRTDKGTAVPGFRRLRAKRGHAGGIRRRYHRPVTPNGRRRSVYKTRRSGRSTPASKDG